MNSSDRHGFPFFTTVLLVLGLIALAAAQNQPGARDRQAPDAMNLLLSGQGVTMITQPVTLANIAIQDLTQDDIIWVGSSPGRSVMVMLQPSVNPIDPQGNPTPIAAGDAVRVTGHLLRAPGSQVLESWGVSPAEAARVRQQGIVLQAVTFEVVKHGG